MNVLLINPSLIKADVKHYSKSIEKNRGVYPPLGLGYVAASLMNAGHYVKIIDADLERDPAGTITREMQQRDYDIVGFYVMTWTFSEANAILRQVKKINPDIKSVFGGPNASSLPVVSLEAGDFDYVVVGEGEDTVIELIRAIEGEASFEAIDGIVYRNKDNKIIQNRHRDLKDDINEISFPAWELFKVNGYSDIFTRCSKFVTMIASRGCPFNCIFCDRLNRMGNRWRIRSPENVLDEIRLLNSRYGIKEFMFYDDNFIFDKKWVYEFCDKLENIRSRIIWECRTRVDTVDKELLKRMRDSGCYRIRYGMESGNDKILKVLKKGITVEQIRECVKITKEAGIEIFAYFMMGSPYETPQTLEDTLALALEVNADFTVFSKTILIVGSELFDWAVNNGYIDRDYWVDFLKGRVANSAPALSTPELCEESVDKYISYAYKKVYFRPEYLISKIKSIKNPRQALRQAKMAVSMIG